MTNAEKPCLVSVRVWGDFACITRPELKAERVSYALLSPSAARGMLEAIYYEPQMYYLVHEIGVIKRGRWFSFRRNEVKKVVLFRDAAWAMAESGEIGPIRAGGGAADATQRGMLALADVEYLITAEIRLSRRVEPPRDSLEKYKGLFIITPASKVHTWTAGPRCCSR
jgi:CRISPR-associated protein Cas5d